MNQLCSDGVTREASPRSRRYSPPTLDGVKFAVVPKGRKFAVVRRIYRRGQWDGKDEDVDVYDTETQADTACRLLSEPAIEVSEEE